MKLFESFVSPVKEPDVELAQKEPMKMSFSEVSKAKRPLRNESPVEPQREGTLATCWVLKETAETVAELIWFWPW